MGRFVLFIFLLGPLLVSASTETGFQQKILTIELNEQGQVFIDRVRVYRDELAREVQQRLWRSYLGNGKMADSIRLGGGTVQQERREEIVKAIREGQSRTRTLLALQKYKKRYEDIGSKKQEKMKKQFPVLFQENF